MSIHTKGTQLYFIDPADDSIVEVGCVTAVSGLSVVTGSLENTCLGNLARTYQADLLTPGQGTFGLNTEPSDASHVRLYALKKAGTTLKWALGWGDGLDVPPSSVDSDGDFVLPTNRSWLHWDAHMTDFPFDFPLGALVNSTVGMQISGDIDWSVKTTST